MLKKKAKPKSKPVRSAEAVAAIRAASTKEGDSIVANPDYVAKHFVTGIYSKIIGLPHSLSRRLIEWLSPGSYCYFLARTRFIDTHFLDALEKGIRQIVILGAGYDSRAIRLSNQLGVVKIYELDLPSTQREKIKRLKDANLSIPENVKYIAQDFNHASIESILSQNGYDLTQPGLFVFEGLSYYLKPETVANIFRFVGDTCTSGSCVAFDYSLRSFVNGDVSTYGGKKVHRWLKKNQEFFLFGLDPDELVDYLNKFGLSVNLDYGPTDIDRHYLRNSSGKSIGRPYGHLRLASAIKL